jgi:hypothetical protein
MHNVQVDAQCMNDTFNPEEMCLKIVLRSFLFRRYTTTKVIIHSQCFSMPWTTPFSDITSLRRKEILALMVIRNDLRS